jgi:glutathione S-transferase
MAAAGYGQVMIELYFAPTPNGWKISVMLEECGLPYSVFPVNITRGEQLTPEFLKLSPNGRVPAIIDRDPPGGGESIAMFESGAILRYLAEKAGRFYPADLRARHIVEQWLMWQMGGLGPMLGQNGHFLLYAPEEKSPTQSSDMDARRAGSTACSMASSDELARLSPANTRLRTSPAFPGS